MMSFKNITPEEYNRLVKNKNRIFDLTFKTPEILNKYRDDENIYDEIKYEEKKNKKIYNYNKILDDNFNKYLPKNKENKENNMLLNTLEYFDNLFKQSNGSNDIDQIKNVFKLLSKKDENKLNYLKNEINFDYFKKSDDNKNKYRNKYKFDNDENIIKSFEKVFKENNIEYNTHDISKFYRIEYLLKKLEDDDRIPRDLNNYFKNKLEDQKKLSYQIPKNENKIISNQDSKG